MPIVNGFGANQHHPNKQEHRRSPQQPHPHTHLIHDFRNINNSARNSQMQHHDSVESTSSTTLEDIGDLDFCGLDSSSSTSHYTISPPPPQSPRGHHEQHVKHSVHKPATSTTHQLHGDPNSDGTTVGNMANSSKTDINHHHYNTDTVESTVNEVHANVVLLIVHRFAPAAFL